MKNCSFSMNFSYFFILLWQSTLLVNWKFKKKVSTKTMATVWLQEHSIQEW